MYSAEGYVFLHLEDKMRFRMLQSLGRTPKKSTLKAALKPEGP